MTRLLVLAIVLALASAGCTFTQCTTWLIDPHLLSPSAPSQPVNVSKCQATL